jgi:PII-like signaling protein
VNEDCTKLTVYFGERDRSGDRFVADAITDACARHEVEASLILRGVAGFGAKQHLRTDRQLSLSEDLPVAAVAVDTRERIERLATEIERLRFDGLLTLERARMLTGPIGAVALPPDLDEGTKLTVYLGRHERVAGGPAFQAVLALLRRSGIAGATVLLGVDGTSHGQRERARFFGRNQGVPLMVVSVGDGERIAAALPELGRLLADPLITLERVRICKRDGQRLAEPAVPDGSDETRVWQKLMIYAGEQARHDGHPLYMALVRELRRAGAAGATSLRGTWGFHGDHNPHGDSFWRLKRRVPVVTIIVDTPSRVRALYPIIDSATGETGLVTSELVPTRRMMSRA